MKDKILPSSPFKNFAELESLAQKAKGSVKRIQIDICDGVFVKNTSWPFTEMTKQEFIDAGNNDLLDLYLPEWESVNYSVDMMCENPESYIKSLVSYGVDEIIIHFRSLDVLDKDDMFQKIILEAKKYELSLILAVDVKTDINSFLEFSKKYLESLDGMQVMGIENIGFQGQTFSDMSLEYVKKIKEFVDKNKNEENSNFKIMFDGGINLETLTKILDSGVNVLCVGSYLTKAPDFSEHLQILKKIMHERDVI